jgi:radical SAM superfamily enzyme YgiQ (UPF0313 family)
MKVLLTNSPVHDDFELMGIRSSASYIYLGSMLGRQKNLGLHKVADARIEDVNISGKNEFIERMQKYDPQIVGTSIYEINYEKVADLVQSVKKAKPGVIFALGGQMATHVPRSVLKMTGADLVFRGEADFTFREAVEKLDKGEDLENLADIDGVVVQKEGKIISSQKSSKIPYLNQKAMMDIDLDFELVEDMQDRVGYKSLGFVFSRGCPNKPCSFCQFSITSNGYRTLTEDRIIEIMTEVNRLPNIKYFDFGDAVFGTSREGAKKLLKRLQKGNFHFDLYHGELSVDQFLEKGEFGKRNVDKEIVSLMNELNFGGELGIEHLSEGGLKKFNKYRYTPEEAMELLRTFANYGTYISASMIHMGVDTSTFDLAEHYSNVIKMYDELGQCKNIVIHPAEIAVPYIGTREYQKIQKQINDNPIYYILCRDFSWLHELPENDGYEFLMKQFMPFDEDVSHALLDLILYRPVFSPSTERKQTDMFGIFMMIERMKKYADSPELKKILNSIQPQSLDTMIASYTAKRTSELIDMYKQIK